jgi:hypothetical protein
MISPCSSTPDPAPFDAYFHGRSSTSAARQQPLRNPNPNTNTDHIVFTTNTSMASPSTLTGDPNSHPTSTFSTGLTSTCLCTAIRVTINDTELFTRPRGHLCHCANCRKVAGSYVSSNLAIEKEKVIVDDPRGVMKKYKDYATGSGKCVERCFCGECGKGVCPNSLPSSSQKVSFWISVHCKVGREGKDADATTVQS